MKTIRFLTCVILLLFAKIGLSQPQNNKTYLKNNRYSQNAIYNEQNLSLVSKKNIINSDIIKFTDEFVILEINALYNAKANSYLAILSVIQNGPTAVAVDSMINIRYNGFCNDLNEYGVKKEDIFIDMISLVPVYEMQVEKKLFSKTYNEVPAGFKLQKNIHVHYEKGETLDKILTIAAKHEIYDLIKVEYFVNNTQAIYDSLIDASISALNKKVERLKKLGIVLDTLKNNYSDTKNVFFPVDRYTSYNSYGGISLTTKRNGVSKTPKKTPTMFYNKMPYHNYDIIINPAFREPSVQYTYKLAVKYHLKPEKKNPERIKEEVIKNIYHIITPEGNIKKLNTN